MLTAKICPLRRNCYQAEASLDVVLSSGDLFLLRILRADFGPGLAQLGEEDVQTSRRVLQGEMFIQVGWIGIAKPGGNRALSRIDLQRQTLRTKLHQRIEHG